MTAVKFVRIRLPHALNRKPPQPTSAHAGTGFNARLALLITAGVGTMAAAYVFCLIALIGGFAVVANNVQLILVVNLVSQTFLQLVLLPIIIVGQNIQGRASDARANSTYQDAEAILHECEQLQQHLEAQDVVLSSLIDQVRTLLPAM